MKQLRTIGERVDLVDDSAILVVATGLWVPRVGVGTGEAADRARQQQSGDQQRRSKTHFQLYHGRPRRNLILHADLGLARPAGITDAVHLRARNALEKPCKTQLS